MAKLVGDRLPPEILAALDGTELDSKVGPAYLLLSPDPDGSPRPCMLSAGEILAPDDRSIRVGLWPGTRTSENLARGVPVLFCYVVPGAVLYVRGQSRPLGRDPETKLERFEIAVASVESDLHKGMPVTEGITFAMESADPADVVASWARQIEALRRA